MVIETQKNSIGTNFGCKYHEGMQQFLKFQELSDKQFTEAVNIFAFDILISNADRNSEKQNMLTNGEEVMIFDHELAFGFVMDLFKNLTPWIFTDYDKKWMEKHFFYNYLKNHFPDFETFINKLERIDDNFWKCVFNHIPEEWKTEQLTIIKDTLNSLIENKDVFLQELNKLVS